MKISTVSSLTVSVKQLGFEADAVFSPSAASFERENVDMGLVSSTDGKEFVAPAELKTTNSYVAGDMDHVTTKTAWTNTANKYVGYVKYLVRVQFLADTVGANMNLRWKITMNDVDSALTNLWRVAFFEATDSAFGKNIGLYSNTPGSKAGFTWDGTSEAAVAGNYTTTALPASETLLAKNTTTYVNTTDGIDQYYGVSIWIDGNATGADNALGGKTLSSLLTFDLLAGDKTITPAP